MTKWLHRKFIKKLVRPLDPVKSNLGQLEFDQRNWRKL